LATLELWRVGRLTRHWALALFAVQFIGVLLTVSRGPIFAAILTVGVWVLAAQRVKATQRLRIFAITLIGVALVLVAVPGGALDLIRPSQTNLGVDTQYRIDLSRSVLEQAGSATLLGTPERSASDLLTNFQSLDSEPAYLLVTHGLIGAAAFALLLLGPLFVVSHAASTPRPSRLFAYLTILLVAFTSLTVAFFGALTTYVWVALALAWSLPWNREEMNVPKKPTVIRRVLQ
jgi:hypothetical protein